MKRVLLVLCILVFAVSLGHELMLDTVPMQQVSFSDIPVLSEQETARMRLRLPWMADSLLLSAAEQTLPQDEKGLFYTPASEGLTVSLPARAKVARTAWKTDANGNTTCTVYRYDGISQSARRLLMTGLPVFDLQLIDRESENIPIGDTGRQLGLVRLFSADETGSVRVQLEAATARVRGASSRNYPKKSYAIAFVDEAGAPRKASLLDFPQDTEYGLNSLYEDDSKIRDILALDLWSALDSYTRKPQEPANAISMEHTELLIDGQYWGLYGLQQLITPDALSLEYGDALFKINGEFLVYKDVRYTHGLEVISDTPMQNGAALVQDAFAAVPEITDAAVPTLDWDNAVNYALLIQLTCAVDSDTRNMALCYRANDNALHMIGWDLDQTFGAYWDDTARNTIAADMALAESDRNAVYQWKDKPFSILYNENPAFREAVKERYWQLRENMLSDASLLGNAAALYDRISSGAYARDMKRWPESAICEDNSFIEAFIPARMAFLDEVFSDRQSID